MKSVALASIIVVLLATPTATTAASDAGRHKEVVVSMMEAINARDLEALDAFVDADVHRHSASTPGVVVENLDQFKAFLESDFAAVPDSVQTLNRILGEGDLIAIHATYAGTQKGAFGPFPPSGKKLEIPFLGILRFEDGKIAEIWVEWDNLNALVQLGHFPPPPAEPPAAE